MKAKTQLLASLAFVLSLSTGCIHNQSLRLPKGAQRDARVVPVRGQPIMVMSENLALVAGATLTGGLVGGLAANAIDQGTSADKRATLSGRLNADASNFKPEIILAEECVKLLNESSKRKFRAVALRAEPLDLPGRDELIRDEMQPFKTKSPRAFDWHLRARDWLKTPPTAEYASRAAEGQSVITVETIFPAVRLINAKTFEMDVAIRVVDSAQGKIIGSRYTMTRRKITPITRDSDFKLFEEDFRRCAREAARECLEGLNLI